MIHKLSLEELPKYQRKGATIIDVRSKEEYSIHHLEGAINIPHERILEGVRNYSKDSILILYCSTGNRSKIASNLLLSMGYSNVYDLGKVSL